MKFTDLLMGLTAHLLISSLTGLTLHPVAILGSTLAGLAVGAWMRQPEQPPQHPQIIVVHPLG